MRKQRSHRAAHRPVLVGGALSLYCIDCREWKPVEDFFAQGRRVDGSQRYKSYCRKCSGVRGKASRLRWLARDLDGPFAACKICRYPVRREDADEGMCPECRTLMARLDYRNARRGMWSSGYDGHEMRMETYEARAAAGLPL